MKVIRVFFIFFIWLLGMAYAQLNIYNYHSDLSEEENQFLIGLVEDIDIVFSDEERREIFKKIDTLGGVISSKNNTVSFKRQAYKLQLVLSKIIEDDRLSVKILGKYLDEYGHLDEYPQYSYQEYCHLKQIVDSDKIQSDCYKKAKYEFDRYFERSINQDDYELSYEYYNDQFNYFMVNFFISNKKDYQGLCRILDHFHENKTSKIAFFSKHVKSVLDWYQREGILSASELPLLCYQELIENDN